MHFKDIKQFVPDGGYEVDIPLDQLQHTIERYQREYRLEMCPDFQRGHVWTPEQQSRYVEFVLRGGRSARVIYFNHPNWMGSMRGEMLLVDGLQRVTACLNFLSDQLPAFGLRFSEFEGRLSSVLCIRFNVNTLKTKAEVLQWYLDMNSGGVVHTTEELERVRRLLQWETWKKVKQNAKIIFRGANGIDYHATVTAFTAPTFSIGVRCDEDGHCCSINIESIHTVIS